MHSLISFNYLKDAVNINGILVFHRFFYYFFKIKKKQTKKMIKDEMEAYLKFIKYMN